MEEEKPAVSPTGKPMVNLPSWAVLALTVLSVVAGALLLVNDGLLTPKQEKLAMVVALVSATLLGTSPGLRKMAPAVLVVLSLGLSGCTGITPYVVTGQSLKVAGNQFADTAEAMNRGLDAGTIPEDEYRKWADFARQFKIFFGPAVDAWHAAVAINDKLLIGELGEAINRLVQELLRYYSLAKRLELLPAGAP